MNARRGTIFVKLACHVVHRLLGGGDTATPGLITSVDQAMCDFHNDRRRKRIDKYGACRRKHCQMMKALLRVEQVAESVSGIRSCEFTMSTNVVGSARLPCMNCTRPFWYAKDRLGVCSKTGWTLTVLLILAGTHYHCKFARSEEVAPV